MMLNGWQGNPASKTSWSGISDAAIWVMSPWGVSPKFPAYAFWQSRSISLEKTHCESVSVL
ncbi:MAG: hypothetical protein WC076_09855, partial [Terrimicrobiaceae bacterium]